MNLRSASKIRSFRSTARDLNPILRSSPRLSGSLTCGTWSNTHRSFDLVMAVLVAAIHDFGAASKDVDGRDEPCHDVEKEPAVNTILNRTVVGQAR